MATKIGPKTVTQRDRSKNLVFCIDAAHSDSYGGEPADNLFADPNNFGGADWNVKNGTWAAYSDPGPHGNGCYSCTATDSDPYAYSNYVRSVSTGNVTFSCWVKGVGATVGMGGDIRINNGSSGGQATIANTTVNYTITGNWQRVSVTQNCTGAGTIKVGIEPPNSATAGQVVLVGDPQLEQSQATTPFTATSRTAANAIKNISGVNSSGTTLTGTFATYGLGGLFRPTTRKVLASEDSNRGHIGAVYWDLDGTDEMIATGQGFQIGNTLQKTVMAWVRGTSGTWLSMTNYGNNYKWQQHAMATAQIMDGSGYNLRYNWADFASATEWKLVADVVDVTQGAAQRVKRYINGDLIASTGQDSDDSDPFYDGTDLYLNIGRMTYNDSASSYAWFNGEIATCMIWAAALTAKEIKDIYIAQKGRFGK